MTVYTVVIITGPFSAMMFSALTKSLYTPPDASRNFLPSCSSRTKAFTTRMPLMFSWTEAFSASYFLNNWVNTFDTVEMISDKATARNTSATRKITDSLPEMDSAATSEKTNVSGARTAMRVIIWKEFWMLLTSVVRRVTRPAVENLSMFAKEKRWMFWYMARRRFAPKPVEAWLARCAQATPKNKLTRASSIISRPYLISADMLPASMPWLISWAITSGISTSITTSPAAHAGVRKAERLYCFT